MLSDDSILLIEVTTALQPPSGDYSDQPVLGCNTFRGSMNPQLNEALSTSNKASISELVPIIRP
jgi:hypothetical protein